MSAGDVVAAAALVVSVGLGVLVALVAWMSRR